MGFGGNLQCKVYVVLRSVIRVVAPLALFGPKGSISLVFATTFFRRRDHFATTLCLCVCVVCACFTIGREAPVAVVCVRVGQARVFACSVVVVGCVCVCVCVRGLPRPHK